MSAILDIETLKAVLVPIVDEAIEKSAKIQRMDTRLGAVETRLDAVETRLNAVETRLDGVETKAHNIELTLEELRSDMEKGFDTIIHFVKKIDHLQFLNEKVVQSDEKITVTSAALKKHIANKKIHVESKR